jgi:predicted permease
MGDLRYAWRTLWRTPIFLVTAVVTLGLGVGATTAIFSLFYQVLLAELPVRQPAELVSIHSTGGLNGYSSSDNFESVFSYPMYLHLRDRSGAVLAGLMARSSGSVDVMRSGQAERVKAETVSGNFFGVLGVRPFAGRLLTPQDDTVRGGNDVAVLGFAYWQKHYGRRDVIGQNVLVNGHPMEVVGIAPGEFRGVLSGQTPDLYLPISMRGVSSPGFTAFDDPAWQWLTVIGRLRPGVPPATAQAAINRLFTSILRDELEQRNIHSAHSRQRILSVHVELHPAQQGLNELEHSWRKPLTVLFAAAGGLLLIACSNLASLFMVRAAARQREIAVRRAVGATRFQIVRQLLAESVLLTLLGGIVGVLLSFALTRSIIHMLPADTAGGWVTSVFNAPILAFTLGVSVLSCLAFGVLPAWFASAEAAAGALKYHARQASLGEARWRQGLVVLEIALCVLLLAGAGLFMKSFSKLLHHNPGFHSENLLSFTLDPGLKGETMGQALNLFTQIRDRLSQSPGVTAVSFCQFGPYSNSNASTNVSVEGYKIAEDENTDAGTNGAAPGYFRTLGIPVLRGREFSAADTLGGEKVAIVNEAFVQRFFHGRDPLGARMAKGAGNSVKLDTLIIGVVPNAQLSGLREAPQPFYYVPFVQSAKADEVAWQAVFLVRTTSGDPALPTAVRQLVRSLDSSLPVTNMEQMQVEIQNSVSQDRAVAILTSASGLLALLFASLALYGVIAYAVTRRTPEIGIRMALGADRGSVVSLVLKEVLWMVVTGSLIGVAAGLVMSRAIASQLFGVEALDAQIFVGAVLVLMAVALLAGASPTLRATRIDPMRALRNE